MPPSCIAALRAERRGRAGSAAAGGAQLAGTACGAACSPSRVGPLPPGERKSRSGFPLQPEQGWAGSTPAAPQHGPEGKQGAEMGARGPAGCRHRKGALKSSRPNTSPARQERPRPGSAGCAERSDRQQLWGYRGEGGRVEKRPGKALGFLGGRQVQ